jgi:hypothetical protein
MDGPGLIDDDSVARYIFKSKINEGVPSFDDLSSTTELDFQVFCPQGVQTDLVSYLFPKTLGRPQRYIAEIDVKFSVNNGSANASVSYRAGVARIGITTVGAGTNTAYVFQNSVDFGSPTMNITFLNTITGTFQYAYSNYVTISNRSAWAVGTLKVIGVLSQ